MQLVIDLILAGLMACASLFAAIGLFVVCAVAAVVTLADGPSKRICLEGLHLLTAITGLPIELRPPIPPSAETQGASEPCLFVLSPERDESSPELVAGPAGGSSWRV